LAAASSPRSSPRRSTQSPRHSSSHIAKSRKDLRL
jgi:hypothetical protein